MSEVEFLEALRQYFRGEKQESIAILAGSAVLLVSGAIMYLAVASHFVRGLAGMILLTGLVGAVVGGTIVLRTDRQVARLSALYEADAPRFVADEQPRIERVVRSFRVYRIAYTVAVVAALAFLLLSSRPLLHGLAVGMLVFAALGFTVDFFAEARAIDYAARVGSQAAKPAVR